MVTALTTIRGAVKFLTMDSGFESRGVWTVRLNATRQGHTLESAAGLLDELLVRFQGEPRIAVASLARLVPLSFAWGEHPGPGTRSSGQMEAEVPGANGRSTILVFHNLVTPGHFRTLGIELVAGRDFEDADVGRSVGIVNETLAQRFWPGQNPLGKRLRHNLGAEEALWIEVVGVARNSKYSWAGEDPLAFIYLPMTATEDKAAAVVLLKAAGPDEESHLVIRDAVRALDPELRPAAVLPIEVGRDLMLLRFRFLSATTTLIAAVALMLGLVGTHGLVGYLASGRTHEIGVRLAVGGTPRQVERLILGPCTRWTLVGNDATARPLRGLLGATSGKRSLILSVRSGMVDRMGSKKWRRLRGRLVYISLRVLVSSLRVVLVIPFSFLWFGLHGRFPPQRRRPPRPIYVLQRNARTLAYIAGSPEITPAHLQSALDVGGELLPPCGFRAIRFSPEAARLWGCAVDAAGGWNAAAIDHLRTALASD